MSTASASSDPNYRPGGGATASDQSAVEETKQQIRSLVSEIADLTRADVAPAQFYQQFLDRVVSAMAAMGGAVWVRDEEGRLGLQYQINLQETRLHDNQTAQRRHGRLLQQALESDAPMLAPPQSGGAAEDEPGNPTDFLLVLALLKTDLESIGVVEIFQRNDSGPNTQRGYLRFLGQMCELAGDFLKSHQLRHFSSRQVLWTQLEDFCRVVHDNLDPRATAYTIANEGRRLIECDRLSVAIRKGNSCRIEAISGQDVFDRRANTVRLLEQLASAVVTAGDPVWYTGDTTDMPPQVEEAVQAYVDESHSKTVAVLPLVRRKPVEDEAARNREPPEAPLGALIVEQIEDSRVPQTLTQRADVVARHSTTALGNALDNDAIFLMPLWRAVGRNRWLVSARNLPWVVSIGGAVLFLLLLLAVLPAPFRMEAKGELQPVLRRNVYAGNKGRVDRVFVEHGAEVQPNQLLLKLRDTELEIGLTEVEGQLVGTDERAKSLERTLHDAKDMKTEERNRVHGQWREEKAKLVSLTAQRDLYQDKMRELSVRSPIAGQVITWDLENRLKTLPVERGQLLLTVADVAGDWQLELRVPEDRMGYVAAARQGILGRRNKGDSLDDVYVSYQLATQPGQTFEGVVKDVHLGAEVHGEEGNTVLIKVAIDKDKLPELRPGTTVTAKLHCGYRPLGYVWFHDVWNFIQSKIIFRYL